MDKLLSDMSKLRIKHTAIMEGGTQVKLVLTFENDKQAVFKPMRLFLNFKNKFVSFTIKVWSRLW